MADTRHKAAIVKVAFLEPKRLVDTGRRAYGLLVLDEHGQIVARPFASRDLRELVEFVRKHKKDGKLGHVSFEPPDGVDKTESKNPRRYEALELAEIYYASTSLKQS
jgi:hypothetical protein